MVEKKSGEIKKIKSFDLRDSCMCAACVDEMSGTKVLKRDTIPEDVHPLSIEPKGNYAVGIVWSDGHKSSIYPYARLLSKDIEEYKK